jgi:hypothetical protein
MRNLRKLIKIEYDIVRNNDLTVHLSYNCCEQSGCLDDTAAVFGDTTNTFCYCESSGSILDVGNLQI